MSHRRIFIAISCVIPNNSGGISECEERFISRQGLGNIEFIDCSDGELFFDVEIFVQYCQLSISWRHDYFTVDVSNQRNLSIKLFRLFEFTVYKKENGPIVISSDKLLARAEKVANLNFIR